MKFDTGMENNSLCSSFLRNLLVESRPSLCNYTLDNVEESYFLMIAWSFLFSSDVLNKANCFMDQTISYEYNK